MSVVITRAVQTSAACPSQWDAWDSDGNYWYLRYRSAHGSAEQYREGPGWCEPDAAVTSPADARYFHADDLHPLDGSMDLVEFCQRAGFTLHLNPGDHQGFGQYLASELRKLTGHD